MVSWLLCDNHALARHYRIICSSSRELPNHQTVNEVSVSVLIRPGRKVGGSDVRMQLGKAGSVQIEDLVRVVGELVGLVSEIVWSYSTIVNFADTERSDLCRADYQTVFLVCVGLLRSNILEDGDARNVSVYEVLVTIVGCTSGYAYGVNTWLKTVPPLGMKPVAAQTL